MRRDEEGAQRWDAHPLRRRVLFSGFYSQKGESLLPSGVGLGRFWVLVDLFTGVVAPTTCSLTTCLTTCRGVVYRRKNRAEGVVYRRTSGI